MLVGDVSARTTILVDDLADTSNTITRAAKLLKKEGATQVIALITHGILSGDAIDRINASALDKVIVTNTVPQDEHKSRCPKLEVLEVGNVFAEVCTKLWLLLEHTNRKTRLFAVSTTVRASACYSITVSTSARSASITGSIPPCHAWCQLPMDLGSGRGRFG